MADITLPPPVSPLSLGPPPRRVRARSADQGCAWLIVFPLVAFVLYFCWRVIFLIITFAFGASYPGTITAITPDGTAADDNSNMFLVAYQFDVAGQPTTDTVRINEDQYQEISTAAPPVIPGASVTVQYLKLGPLSRSYIHQIPQKGPAKLFCSIPCGIFLLLFAFLMVWVAWLGPMRVRWLYQHGLAVPGTIVSKRLRSTDEDEYWHYATHAFIHPATGQQVTAENFVRKSIWLTLSENQQVTVLCHPTNPKRSVVYELGEFKVLP